MPNNNTFCNLHEKEVSAIATLASSVEAIHGDVKWIRKIGNFVGLFIIAMIPIMVSVCVYLAKLDNRLSVVEYKIDAHLKDKP